MSKHSGDEDLDLPIAVRRKRRSSIGLGALTSSQNADTAIARAGAMETPPLTPMVVVKKRRVRFSAPAPSMLSNELSIGLTPSTERASRRLKSKVPNRRHSAPSRSWNLDLSSSSISGTRQFAPLRQVLEGRVKRRLRRNHLSEEMNNIEYEKKHREKSRLAELARLRSALQNKDNEMQSMRDEWNFRRQVADGVSKSQESELHHKVRELESQISVLKTELSQREASPMHDETDWTFAARDPFHDYNDDHGDHNDDDDNDEHMPQYDNDFGNTTNMNDIIASTPTRCEFLSPPSTLPNTPTMSNPPLYNISSTQADLDDPEKEQLEKQVAVLQSDLNRLSTALKRTAEHHDQLTCKLSQFMSSEGHSSDSSNLDTALDTLLTHLASSQSSHNETKATLDTLRIEIGKLGFSPTSPPDQMLAMIASQFRQARLNLEYMAPGETPIGFENQSLLSLLVERVRLLLQQLEERDADIDQYREQELSLQKQLDAQLGCLEVVQKDLANAKTEIQSLNDELSLQASSSEKLKKALDSYRLEVKGLEQLVGRMERSHGDAEAQLKRDLEDAVRQAEGLEAEVESYEVEKQAARAVAEGRELLLEEFKTKLNSALKAIENLKMEMETLITKQTAEMAQLQEDKDREFDVLKSIFRQREEEKEEDYIADVTAREERIEEISEKFNGLRQALGAAHSMIESLENEKSELETRLRYERGRANGVVAVMREQLKNALNVGLGFLENEDDLSHEPTISETAAGGAMAMAAAPLVKKNTSKRRKYDSGLGFLEEEEEHRNWDEEGYDGLTM